MAKYKKPIQKNLTDEQTSILLLMKSFDPKITLKEAIIKCPSVIGKDEPCVYMNHLSSYRKHGASTRNSLLTRDSFLASMKSSDFQVTEWSVRKRRDKDGKTYLNFSICGFPLHRYKSKEVVYYYRADDEDLYIDHWIGHSAKSWVFQKEITDQSEINRLRWSGVEIHKQPLTSFPEYDPRWPISKKDLRELIAQQKKFTQ